ncbi:hypothetical protein ACOBV8_17815 [Pseudoalteromonas espejiana]
MIAHALSNTQKQAERKTEVVELVELVELKVPQNIKSIANKPSGITKHPANKSLKKQRKLSFQKRQINTTAMLMYKNLQQVTYLN